MKKTIVQKGDAVLGHIAEPVVLDEIQTPRIQAILEDMREALDGEKDGVAIAAPQIGVSLRIFLVADKAYPNSRKDRPLVFINPEITKHSKEKRYMQEGCLSVRWKYGDALRWKQATVRAHDEKGQEFTTSGSGLIAQIFQHETDHLDGILFDEHAENLRDLTEEEIDEYKKDLENN